MGCREDDAFLTCFGGEPLAEEESEAESSESESPLLDMFLPTDIRVATEAEKRWAAAKPRLGEDQYLLNLKDLKDRLTPKGRAVR